MSVQTRRQTFVGSTLGSQRHICAFFHSPEEEYRVLLPFIEEGLDRGAKAFHIVDPNLRDEHLRRLQAVGIDTAAAEERGQLEVRRWQDAHLREGNFDQDRMLALIEEILGAGPARGFSHTRLLPLAPLAAEALPGGTKQPALDRSAPFAKNRSGKPSLS
jgi:hypothetical protein